MATEIKRNLNFSEVLEEEESLVPSRSQIYPKLLHLFEVTSNLLIDKMSKLQLLSWLWSYSSENLPLISNTR